MDRGAAVIDPFGPPRNRRTARRLAELRALGEPDGAVLPKLLRLYVKPSLPKLLPSNAKPVLMHLLKLLLLVKLKPKRLLPNLPPKKKNLSFMIGPPKLKP